jgi:large subunit ribosomal protein L15
MDLSSLSNASETRKKRKRIGRGPSSGTGKTSGKGHKGQKARAGFKLVRGFEGGQMPLHRRMPKRGFNHQDRFPLAIVNVDTLEAAFEAGAEIAPEVLIEKGLVDARKGGVKVLGRGKITKKLDLVVHAVTASARAKIEAAGGSVKLIELLPTTREKKPQED